MRNLQISIFIAYFVSIVLGNLLVAHVGRWGILITSFVLIPFDFVIRCVIHELYRGWKMYGMLLITIGGGAIATYAINHNAGSVAIGSVLGFASGGLIASLYYQLTIKKNPFVKVNGSDMTALIVDSIVFQLVAFSTVSFVLILGQIWIKIAGGILWYYIIIIRLKLIQKIKFRNYGR